MSSLRAKSLAENRTQLLVLWTTENETSIIKHVQVVRGHPYKESSMIMAKCQGYGNQEFSARVLKVSVDIEELKEAQVAWEKHQDHEHDASAVDLVDKDSRKDVEKITFRKPTKPAKRPMSDITSGTVNKKQKANVPIRKPCNFYSDPTSDNDDADIEIHDEPQNHITYESQDTEKENINSDKEINSVYRPILFDFAMNGSNPVIAPMPSNPNPVLHRPYLPVCSSTPLDIDKEPIEYSTSIGCPPVRKELFIGGIVNSSSSSDIRNVSDLHSIDRVYREEIRLDSNDDASTIHSLCKSVNQLVETVNQQTKAIQNLTSLNVFQSSALQLLLKHNKISLPESVVLPGTCTTVQQLDPENLVCTDERIWYVMVGELEGKTLSKTLLDSLCDGVVEGDPKFPSQAELHSLAKTCGNATLFCKAILFKILRLYEVFEANVHGRKNGRHGKSLKHLCGIKVRFALQNTINFKSQSSSTTDIDNTIKACVNCINSALRHIWNRRFSNISLPPLPDNIPIPSQASSAPIRPQSDM